MQLNPEQVRKLAKLTVGACGEDITCEEWFARVTRYVEIELSGGPVPAEFACIRRHIEICPECEEQLEALRRALGAG